MTKVIFRKKYWNDSKAWEVMAFFPECHVNPGNIMCLGEGGHSEASYEFYLSTKPCAEKEYADLKNILENIYEYDDLKVVKHFTRHDQERAWWPERFKEDAI